MEEKIFEQHAWAPWVRGPPIHCRICRVVVTPPVLKCMWSHIVTSTNSKSWGCLA